MKINNISAQNYRPFAILEEVRLGPQATIVGRNDTGKSNMLQALKLFLQEKPKINEEDVHDGANKNDDVIIEIAFNSLPKKIEIEEGIETTLQEELLLDDKNLLRIRKIYPRENLTKCKIILIIHDFEDVNFAGLAALKESELNEKCKSFGIEVKKSGRSITNKSKREELRTKAREKGIKLVSRELQLTEKDDLWKTINSLLPEFVLFEADTRLGIDETSFQNQFKPIIQTAITQPDVIKLKNEFKTKIGNAIQFEVNKIFEWFKRHTDAFVDLRAIPSFALDKSVTFEILGKDQHNVEKSLEQRGSGIRRLIMVAFFQYLAERSLEVAGNYVFAVEEPENCLHPGLQRDLIASFRQLADEGYQTIVTSHSPVFAGASPIKDLALVVREAGVAKAIQSPELEPSDIAEQLGVEPADQITGYNACIFVEGYKDVLFLKTIVSKLKGDGHIDATFDDKRIGFALAGGENLRHWINLRALSRLSRRFAVIIDSDKASESSNIPERKLNWKRKCEAEGGTFIILKKREAENYLHPDAISRSGRTMPTGGYNGFTKMKKLFGENVIKVIEDMSCDEILEMDKYEQDGVEHHELIEIAEKLLSITTT